MATTIVMRLPMVCPTIGKARWVYNIAEVDTVGKDSRGSKVAFFHRLVSCSLFETASPSFALYLQVQDSFRS